MFDFFGDRVFGGQVWRQRLARLGFIWAVWTLVGLFFSSQIYFYFAPTERAVTFLRALAWQMPAVYLMALTTPLVLWLARRHRIERINWRRSLLVHVLAGTLVASFWSACHVTYDSLFDGTFSRLTLFNLGRRSFVQLDKELLVYWIIVLISHASDYYARLREGELRASQAQLQALKMQLHPHFLFNALNSISALVRKDPEAADRMIARLGDFLRLTLEASATQEVLLRQELEFLDCYLEIERVRYHDRLTTRLDIDPQTLNCRVPNLILQPIVENAIRHGIAPTSKPGRIEISAERRDGMLRLQVRDNGKGLLGAPRNVSTKVGVGLSNTRARLARLYGAAHRFELGEGPHGGAVVTVEVPFQSRGGRAEGAAHAGLGGGGYVPALSE